MADSINWGVLQPLNQMAPIHSATPQANPAQMGGGGGMLDPYAAQKMQIEQQRLGLEQQQTESALKTAALQQQGMGITNQTNQLGLETAQRSAQYQKAANDAYQAVIQKGGSKDQAMTAFSANLDPTSRETFDETRENHKTEVAKGNYAQLDNAAGAVSGFIQQIQSGGDPAKIIPYANQTIHRIDPGAPQIKTVDDLNNYGVVTKGTLLDPKVQMDYAFKRMEPVIKANADADSKIRVSAQTAADAEARGSQKILATQEAYDSINNKIQAWNQQHPDSAITTGPGSSTWLGVKQKAAAMGFPTADLDKMEQLSAARDTMVSQTLGNLKTIPRNEKILAPFTNALSNPSDTIGAQKVKSQLLTYGAKEKVAFSDFLGEYAQANNGNIVGALNQWSKFLSNDPGLVKGGLPSPNYVGDKDNYMKFTDKNYNPPAPKQPESNPSNQVSPHTQTINGVTYTYKDGKWVY